MAKVDHSLVMSIQHNNPKKSINQAAKIYKVGSSKEEVNAIIDDEIASFGHNCDLCEYKTNNKGNLRQHLKRRHDDEGKICQCDLCDKSYTNKSNLRPGVVVYSPVWYLWVRTECSVQQKT